MGNRDAHERQEPTGVELVWPGKRTTVERIALPFQTIETVNEGRAAREDLRLFRQRGEALPEWRNKLIWGDNLYVMGSLRDEFAGDIDLIYIDPPFATGADFSFTVEIGEQELTKEPSLIEEKAYRDTWGRGLESYLQMTYDRLTLMRELMAESGCIFVHLDWHVSHAVKLVLDEVFGVNCFMNEITWKRYAAHSLSTKRFDTITDRLLFYVKNPSQCQFTLQYEQLDEEELERRFPHIEPETGRRFQHVALEQTSNASSRGEERVIRGRTATTSIGWRWTQQTFDNRLAENPFLIYWTANGRPRYKVYADEYAGRPLGDLWTDIPYLSAGDSTRVDYATQKPERLLQRVVEAGSKTGDLVADFFCGSGTTLAAAEALGRRWIGCDLSRWAIHTTRKRLLDLQVQDEDGTQRGCRPFEVVNLGKYERRYWQMSVVNGGRGDDQALWEYIRFIVGLYGAQTVSGFTDLHGRKGNRMVHVGATDGPVTMFEIEAGLAECQDAGQKALDVLGWEWEMGLYDVMPKLAEARGIDLRMLQIPREVMDPRAVERGDVRFYELAYLDAELQRDGRSKRRARVALNSFVIPNPELIPAEVRDKVRKWSDYIDYWAVDWHYRQDTFHNQWQDYRTRKDRSLKIQSDWYTYDEAGTYRVMVKVIDIFGNDTTTMLEAEVE